MVRTLAARVMLALTFVAALASAQTIVPLNTGYNHAAFAPYPTVTTMISTTRDDYWINIASYPPTTPAAPAPSFVLQSPSGWSPPIAGSSWISARNQAASAPGVTDANPGYTIFRKCFCLLSNYNNPQISFSVRADDTVQVWLNTQVRVLVPPQFGNFGSTTAIASLPSNPAWFRTGLNCLYVLVEDYRGITGFNLAGTVQANGLAPVPAFGVEQTFDCPCRTPSPGNPAVLDVTAEQDDTEVVAELIRIAETRRRSRMRLR